MRTKTAEPPLPSDTLSVVFPHGHPHGHPHTLPDVDTEPGTYTFPDCKCYVIRNADGSSYFVPESERNG